MKNRKAQKAIVVKISAHGAGIADAWLAEAGVPAFRGGGTFCELS
jgi:hypothetical protein